MYVLLYDIFIKIMCRPWCYLLCCTIGGVYEQIAMIYRFDLYSSPDSCSAASVVLQLSHVAHPRFICWYLPGLL